MVFFSITRLMRQPELFSLREYLGGCDGAIVTLAGITVDVDGDCYIRIRKAVKEKEIVEGRKIISTIELWGPKLWKELHSWAMTVDLSKSCEISNFMTAFSAKLPCGECREHWFDIVKVHPAPRSSDNKAMFIWTVHRHNDVNVMLNKKTLSMQDAMKIWATEKSQKSSKSHPL